MRAWLLDSVALIDWYCARSGVETYLREILAGRASGAFSTVSELELWQGVRPGEESAHRAMLALLHRVPMDGMIARSAGQLRQQFGLNNLSLPDAAIAASAQVTSKTLVTRNTRDFEQLRDIISVEFYSKTQLQT